MEIIPVTNITYAQYKGNKKHRENEQKEFVEVVEDLTNFKKCDIICIGKIVDIKI